MLKLILKTLALVAVLVPAIAQSAPTPAQLCESAVELASAKYAQCRLTAESKFSKTGDAPKRTAALTKCSQKLSDAFSRATLRYGAPNCTGSPSTAYDAYLSQCSDDVTAAAVAGGTVPSCGNGTIDVVGEQCDGGDLGSETCASLGFPGGGALGCTAGCALDTSGCTSSVCGNGVSESGESCDAADLRSASCESIGFLHGSLACTAGCVLDTSGCGNDRFVDNGDGTISDFQTGLMWEKKDQVAGGQHYVGTTYRQDMSASPSLNQSLFGWVAGLNLNQFAGHGDWRIPTTVELQTIYDPTGFPTKYFSIFVSPCTAGCELTTCSCGAPFSWSAQMGVVFSFTSSATGGSCTGAIDSDCPFRAVRTGR